MRTLLCLTVAAILPLPVVVAQEKKGVEPVKIIKLDRKEPVVFEKDIFPIFRNRCLVCHSGSVVKDNGNFDISTYENLIKGGKRGSPLLPGKSDKSTLYTMLTREGKPFMPPRSEDPVTPEELALIKLWIEEGAKAPKGTLEIKPKVLVGLLPAIVNPVRALAISPDKSTLASGRGNQIHIYDPNSGTHIRSLIAPELKTFDGKDVKAAHLSIVESMAFSPDGKYLVSGSFQEISIWDVQTGALRQTIPGFTEKVVAVAFSLDGKLFATAGGAPTEEGEIKIFEVGDWKEVAEIKNGHSDTVYGLSFSPDNKMIATGSADKFVKVFEIPSGKFVKSFEGHTHQVLDVGWSSDGKRLASAGADAAVKIWDFEKGEQERSINVNTKQVTRLEFIGNTTQVVISTGGGAIRYYNVTNGGLVRNFPTMKDYVYAVDVSTDGNLVAAGGEEGSVQVFNGANGQLLRTLLPPGAVPETAKK
jgi:WD40 repeat protein